MDEQTRKVLEAYPVPWTVDVRDTGLVSLLDSTGYALVRMNAARANVEWLTLAATAVNAYAAQAEQAEQVKALVEALRPVAAIADAYPASYPDRAIGWEFVTAGGERLRLTLGDARKAAAALKAVEGKEATP